MNCRKILSALVLSSCLATSGHARSNFFRHDHTLTPSKLPKATKAHPVQSLHREDAHEDILIIESLKGLLLVGVDKFNRENVVTKDLHLVDGVDTHELEHPGEHKHLQAHLKRYLGCSVTNKTLREIKQDIIKFYDDYDRPVVTVFIPTQKIHCGVLQVHVIEGKVGEVTYDGQEYFTEKDISRWVRLVEGASIDTDDLINDLMVINRNPFRQTNVVFSPGKDLGDTDIKFVTLDRRLWRPYIGSENSGYPSTGFNRFYYGISFGKVLGWDHQLDYQYTMNTKHDAFQAHTAKYVATLPWRHIISLYGGYSKVETSLEELPLNNKGANSQASLRYEIPLRPYPNYLHEIIVGFDYKRTNNDLITIGFPRIGSIVNLSQLVIGYNGGWEGQKNKFSATIESFWSPTKWLPHQNKSNFESLRPGADVHYFYMRGSFAYDHRMWKDSEIQLRLRTQFATNSLLPTEEYGVGGYDTVRGYSEREINGDHAVLGNIELYSPPISLLKHIWKKAPADHFQLLAFLDYGYVANISKAAFEPGHEFACGIGPGLRYRIKQNVVMRVDWGFQLHSTGFNSRFYNRVHWGLMASY